MQRPIERKVENMKKLTLSVSGALRQLNLDYGTRYVVSDIASFCNCSVQSLYRLSTDSPFSLIYSVCEALFTYYPDYNDCYFDFSKYCLLLSDDPFFYL